MQTRVIYLKGDASDEEKLAAYAPGYKLQGVVNCQGQIVGYMIREPWLTGEAPLENRACINPTNTKPPESQGVPIETKQLPADAFVNKPSTPPKNKHRR